jgi:hypothetical protein
VTGLPQARSRTGATCLHFVRSGEGLDREVHYLDALGNRTADDNGVWVCRYEHDGRGLVTRVTYLGPDGKPILHRRERIAGSASDYDERGNEVEWACFGVDGRPCANKDGYHRITHLYDEWGNLAEWACFGTDGGRCANKDGYHRNTYRYDEQGNPVEWACFGVDDRPCADKDGVHRLSHRYDERGNEAERACFGVDGRPCANKDGVHRSTHRYDERGNLVEWAYFDVEGRACASNDGYHRSTHRYDERGNLVEWACFGTDGGPCAHKDGVHRSTHRFDERGNQVESAYFGTDGRPCLRSNGRAGWVAKYDAFGVQREITYFGLGGRPQETARFDEKGNSVELVRYADEALRPLLGPNVARRRQVLGKSSQVIEEVYTDAEGRPVHGRAGYARFRVELTGKGEVERRTYFDKDGRVVPTRVSVWGVAPGSQGERLRLRAGDVLLRYDGKAVAQAWLFEQQHNAGPVPPRPRRLAFSRGGKEQTVELAAGPHGLDLQDVAVPAREDKGR